MDTTLTFGPMMPDQPGYKNPGVMLARNVIPRTTSYGPFRSLSRVSDSQLNSRCLGAISARDDDNNSFLYAGTASKLYEFTANTFTDQSKGGGYATPSDAAWEAVVWNVTGEVIFTNHADPVQSMIIGGGSSSAFADLFTSTLKPKAKHIAIVNRFLVLGWTTDAVDGERSSRTWWSALDNAADMDPDAATQCDYEDHAEGGSVTRIIGGTEYGLIFQNDMVRTMRYVGAGTVFEMLPIAYAPGCPIPNSVIAQRGLAFYISEAGFHGFRGGSVQPIGDGRVDRYFWDQFDIANARYVSAAIDPINKIVVWAFPGAGATDVPNRLLMCKWDEMKWTEAETELELIMKAETQGYTLDGLDTLGTNIDNASVFDESLDSDKWKGGKFRFAAIDSTHRLSYFTGTPLAATIETGDVELIPGRRSQVNAVRPLVDGSDGRVSVASRQRIKDTVTYGSASDMNDSGLCPVRSQGMVHRFKLSLTASLSWSHVQGLDINFVQGSDR